MKKRSKRLATAVVLTHAVKRLPLILGGAVVAGKTFTQQIRRKNQKKKGVITMKKSTFVSLIIFLSAVAGALAAAYVYLTKRERELDEYEQMLFSEDYDDDLSEGDPMEETAQEEQPMQPETADEEIPAHEAE